MARLRAIASTHDAALPYDGAYVAALCHTWRYTS
jgi:hypothetical protein